MKYFVYRRTGDQEMQYPDNWTLVGTYTDINEADAKAVEFCRGELYETESRGSELRRGFFGRKSEKSWDSMITTKAIH